MFGKNNKNNNNFLQVKEERQSNSCVCFAGDLFPLVKRAIQRIKGSIKLENCSYIIIITQA